MSGGTTATGMHVVRGIDVGGTSTKIVDVDLGRRSIVRQRTISTPVGMTEEGWLDFLSRLCAPSAQGPPRGAGIALPGIVDERRGIVVDAANLRLTAFEVGPRLADRGVRVRLIHDVRAAGTAEFATLGRDPGEPVVFVGIGTGIAAAIRANGRMLVGHAGAAGEIGHVSVPGATSRCGCGRIGCLESVASAAAIRRRYRGRGGSAAASAEAIASRVAIGEPLAGAVWAEAVSALAGVLAGVVLALDPGTIVVGGGLAESGPTLLDPLAEALRTSLAPFGSPELRPARWGRFAGAIGAAMTAADGAGGT